MAQHNSIDPHFFLNKKRGFSHDDEKIIQTSPSNETPARRFQHASTRGKAQRQRRKRHMTEISQKKKRV